MTTQEPVCEQELRQNARQWAARLCAVDVRYDCDADLVDTAEHFAEVMEQRRFLPQFFVRHFEDAMVDCRLPQDFPQPEADAYARPMPQRRGVWFPGMVQRDHLLPELGTPDIPPLEGRQPLLPAEGSALGAINLAAHLTKDGQVDHELLTQTVHTAVHLLDNAIDASDYADSRQSRFTRATRRIGLGMMGLAQVLKAKELSYDSEEARRTAQELAKLIDAQAHLASQNLARQRGAFALFSESRQRNGEKTRNSALTATAPNEVLAAICGVTPGLSADEEVSAEACVKMQAAVQRYTDGSVYLPIPANTREQMQELCTMGYLLGCKSIEAGEVQAGEIPDFLKKPHPQEMPENTILFAKMEEDSEADDQPQPLFCPACGRALHKKRIVPVCDSCGPLMCLQTTEVLK